MNRGTTNPREGTKLAALPLAPAVAVHGGAFLGPQPAVAVGVVQSQILPKSFGRGGGNRRIDHPLPLAGPLAVPVAMLLHLLLAGNLILLPTSW